MHILQYNHNMSTENTEDSPTTSDSEEDVCRGLPGPGIESYQTVIGWVTQCLLDIAHAQEYIREKWPDKMWVIFVGNDQYCGLLESKNALVEKAHIEDGQQQSCIEKDT